MIYSLHKLCRSFWFRDMLRFHELRENPVTVKYVDEAAIEVQIIAERLRRGLVKMTCQCQQYSKAGWCRHCLALLCDRVTLQSDQQQLALNDIVAGTDLKHAAKKVEHVLETFAGAYRGMKHHLPRTLDAGQLHIFAAKSYEVSICAQQVATAISAFIKELRPVADAK